MNKNKFFYEIKKYLNDNNIECKFDEQKPFIRNIKHSLTYTYFCIWRREHADEIFICIECRNEKGYSNLKKLFDNNKDKIESIVGEKLCVRLTKYLRIGFSIYCTEDNYSAVLPKCQEKFLLLIKVFNSVASN